MRNRNWLTNDRIQRRLFVASKMSLPQKLPRQFVSVACAMLLIGLVMSLTGCAHQSVPPCPLPETTSKPALREPIPSESYSEQWRKLVEKSRLKLIGTPPTQ